MCFIRRTSPISIRKWQILNFSTTQKFIRLTRQVRKKMTEFFASFHFLTCNAVTELHSLLIHSANPQSRPVGIIVFEHVVHTYVRVRPHFSNLAKQNNRKQCSLLARLWVWPSGSLMTSVLYLLLLLLSTDSAFFDDWLKIIGLQTSDDIYPGPLTLPNVS